MKVVVGVDSSTQSCTVVLRAMDSGEPIAVGRSPHPATTPPVSEQHLHDWSWLLHARLGPVGSSAYCLSLTAISTGPNGSRGCSNQAAALGMGVRIGDVVVSLGTSGVVYTRCEEPVYDPSGWVNGNADATGGFLPLSAL